LLTDSIDAAPFLTDWRGLWHGAALGVALPETPQSVAAIVRWCAQHKVPVVPQGGNTGLSGGATPDGSGAALVLSLKHLDQVRAVDPLNATMTLDAGCLLRTAQRAAEEVGRLLPLSLAAEGSCTIGGNLATNAGGTGVLRYGNARELCLGLEVVTAQGELWDGLRGLRKDNSGYDLRDLFIGSEGTLGVITGAVMKLVPRPAARVAALLAIPSVEAALRLLEEARSRLDTGLTAFEMLSETCLSLVLRHVPTARRPIGTVTPWYVLLELADPNEEDRARAQIEALLVVGLERGWVEDGVIAESLAQSRALWALREDVSDAQGAAGKTIKHDIALPISTIAAFLAEADAAVAARWPQLRFVTFGHLGDGNLHYNFSPAEGDRTADILADQDDLNAFVHDIVVRHGGTISAEHGLGVLRRDEAARFKSPVELAMMHAIKAALDPDGIMNPGKLVP
jgi:FAD/FMN-containing dehydrogenase